MFDSQKNIGVHLAADCSLAHRFAVTGAVEEAPCLPHRPYRQGALIPSGTWQELESTAVQDLVCRDPNVLPSQQLINIFRCSEPVLQTLRKSGLQGSTVEEIESHFTADCYADALDQVSDHLAGWLLQPEFFRILGICVQPGNLLTTTNHFDEDLQTVSWSGLHIDDWAGEAQSDPNCHVRQLCINLGSSARYFIFGSRLLQASVRGLDKYQKVVKSYFANGPAMLYRIRLDPGEVYIAPTDSIVHDGSTLGSTGPDITFNLRGVFHKSFSQG